MVNLHNGALQQKEGAPAFHTTMDGSGEHYGK